MMCYYLRWAYEVHQTYKSGSCRPWKLLKAISPKWLGQNHLLWVYPKYKDNKGAWLRMAGKGPTRTEHTSTMVPQWCLSGSWASGTSACYVLSNSLQKVTADSMPDIVLSLIPEKCNTKSLLTFPVKEERGTNALPSLLYFPPEQYTYVHKQETGIRQWVSQSLLAPKTGLLMGTLMLKSIRPVIVLTDNTILLSPQQVQACHLRGLKTTATIQQQMTPPTHTPWGRRWRGVSQSPRTLNPKVEMLCLYCKWHGKLVKDWKPMVVRYSAT